MKLSDLIDSSSRIGKNNGTDALFFPRDKDEIFKIPICPIVGPDLLILHYSPSGEFNVKTLIIWS